MKIWPLIGGIAAASGATLLYGALVEANRLVVERRRLRLPLWPKSRNGYSIALLGDLHVRDRSSIELAERAIDAALNESPDAICLVGDYVEDWRPGAPYMLSNAIGQLAEYSGPKIAVPGNHDHRNGGIQNLEPIFGEVGVVLLRNDIREINGIAWIGVDSVNAMEANPFVPMMAWAEHELPAVVLWHEPDAVDWLPDGAALMLSGHSHGGQFTFPWGWTPMHTRNGRKYVKGFHPDAPTPLYVTKGIGVTGPPSRLCCPPEVAILELYSV